MPGGIYIRTPEIRRKQSDAMRGKVHSIEQNRKQSEFMKGNQYALGYCHTSETRKQISEKLKGRPKLPFSDEHCKAISAGKIGKSIDRRKPMPECTKKHLSQIKTGVSTPQTGDCWDCHHLAFNKEDNQFNLKILRHGNHSAFHNRFKRNNFMLRICKSVMEEVVKVNTERYYGD